MSSSDPGIVCFQHCGPKVFCIRLPERCPSCTRDLQEALFKLMPFRLPFPFIRASQYPGAVVLRPTTGDFLNEYYNSKDLHIGVTTSTGAIVEFDRGGLRRHTEKGSKSSWGQSLLVEQIPEAWIDHWDSVLLQTCKKPMWSSQEYREDSNNCYTFVLSFLEALAYGELSKAAQNRTLFCEKYIVPRTTAAGKYISLYRKIRDHGLYIHSSPTNGINSSGSHGIEKPNTFGIGGKLCSIRE
uniref:MKRN2 opposite strand protein n=1 Tax=Phlebotomus kandelakii TaxID=1109342 RepID=A0A6B2EHX6_9DIPT